MKNTIIAVVIVVLFVLSGVWMYVSSGTATEGPIKVGFIGPLTGDAASLGTVAQASVALAIDEINAAGGVDGRKIEMIYEDGQCSAQPASSAANKLINADKVTAIVGGLCSSETAAFAPMAMQNKVNVISYCSSAPNLSQTGAYFSRVYPSDAYQGKFAAEYAYNTLGARKVAVIYHVSDWGTGIKSVFAQRFQELGGEIVSDEGAPQTARDYRTQLSKVKVANPDYIYAPTYPEGGTVLLKQAKEMGIATKFLGGDAWSDTKLQKDVSTLELDIRYTEGKTNSSDEFKTKLLARAGGSEVPLCATQSYDAAYVLAKALKNAGTDPDALSKAIRDLKYDGVSGHIEFDQNGDLTSASYIVKRIANGTAVEVQ